MASPRLTKAGRAVWFVPPKDGGGTIWPVTTQGWWAVVLAFWLILAGGCAGMAGSVLTLSFWPMVAAFIIVAAGLGVFGVIVSRHTE